MLFIYNLLQIILVVFLLPFLILVVLLRPKYRGSTWLRLGFGLGDLTLDLPLARPRIWIHALSVGEVSSAQSFVRKLRHEYPDALLVFSASTRSGFKYASSILAESVNLLVPFPLDIFWSVEHFVRKLRPDIFILVETDLWPNFLASLARHNVPALLVNGRISEDSYQKYRRFKFFFGPLFSSFKYIAMQTVADIEYMKSLGVPADLLLNLGNLKYGVMDDSLALDRSGSTLIINEQRDKRLWVAGSTHPGEEEAIFKVYQQLRELFDDLYLVIAPRNVERGAELAIMASRENLSSVRRSEGGGATGDLLILDTLGELVSFYRKAEFAFVGGSLVEERGHNPLEPAVFGKPVIFGPHMEDFAEIVENLLDIGGAVRIEGVDDMVVILKEWLTNDEKRLEVGRCGAKLVKTQRGVTERHVELVGKIIDGKKC